MIRRIVSCTAVLVAGSAMVAVAAPKDDVSAAAKKLADAPNYSWKATTEMAGGGGQGRGRMMGRMIRNFKAPAQEAANLASKSKEITKSGDAYQADLTEDGVKEMLSLGRRPGADAGNAPPAPTNTRGTVKFWMKDGALAKYEYNVKGTMSFQGQEREIDRTTTVEIKDVGSTKVEVPADAKGKVS